MRFQQAMHLHLWWVWLGSSACADLPIIDLGENPRGTEGEGTTTVLGSTEGGIVTSTGVGELSFTESGESGVGESTPMDEDATDFEEGGRTGGSCDRGQLNGNALLASGREHEVLGFTEISGFLTVDGTDLADLGALHCLRSVGMGIYIGNNGSLRSLRGLEALEITNSLTIVGNPELVDFSGLEALHSVEALQVANNARLAELNGLVELRTVKHLALEQLPGLQSLAGLANLDYSQLIIRALPPGLDWSRLAVQRANLKEVAVLDQPGITDLSLLSGLQVLEDLRLVNLPDLVHLRGLESLRHVGADGLGQIWFEDLPQLVDINGLDPQREGQLVTASRLEIHRAPALDACAVAHLIEGIELGTPSQTSGLAECSVACEGPVCPAP